MFPFGHVDDWLFEKAFQPWSEDFERFTGWNCFVLGMICLFISVPALWISIFLAVMDRPPIVTYAFVIVSVLSGLYLMLIEWAALYLNNNKARKKVGVFINEHRTNPNEAFGRMVLIFMCPPLMVMKIVEILSDGGWDNLTWLFGALFLVAVSYFKACTPLPRVTAVRTEE